MAHIRHNHERGGNIVGLHFDGNYRSFIYDGTTYTTLDVPGAADTYLYGIDGDNIVGRYSDADYNSQSFVSAIPEPATLSLLTLGGLMLLRRRR